MFANQLMASKLGKRTVTFNSKLLDKGPELVDGQLIQIKIVFNVACSLDLYMHRNTKWTPDFTGFLVGDALLLTGPAGGKIAIRLIIGGCKCYIYPI
jgi:hypothetical protein